MQRMHDATGLFNRGSGRHEGLGRHLSAERPQRGSGVAPAGKDVAVDAVQRESFEESTVRRRAVAEVHNGHGVQAIRGQGLLARWRRMTRLLDGLLVADDPLVDR